MLDLNNKEQMQEFCNHVVVAKVIADSIGLNPSYEKIVRISDELNLSPEDIYSYIQLFKYMQKQMIL